MSSTSGLWNQLLKSIVICALLVAGSIAMVAFSGGYELIDGSDTSSYARVFSDTSDVFAEGDYRDRLAYYRTFGYPLALLFAEAIGGVQLIPILNHLVWFLAAFVFFLAAYKSSESQIFAVVVSIPLFFSPALGLIGINQSDFLGLALGVLSISLTLLLVAKHRFLVALLTALAVTSCYQVRPLYIFLVPLIPLAVAVLPGHPFKKRLRMAMVTAVLIAVPLLGYATMRAVLVGHFGLVAFGGYNTIGIAAPLLDEELIDQIDDDHRELAATLHADLAAKKRLMVPGGDIKRWSGRYSDTIWRVLRPAALKWARGRFNDRTRTEFEALVAAGDDAPALKELRAAKKYEVRIDMNAAFTTLSRQILMERPQMYFSWVRYTFVGLLADTLEVSMMKASIAVTALGLLGFGLSSRRRRSSDDRRSKLKTAVFNTLVLAVAFWAGPLLLISLVEKPIGRYMVAASSIIPCAALAVFWLGAQGLTRSRAHEIHD